MPSVIVPAEFFIKERNQIYGNWQLALVRELVSNSIDAHATEIKIETSVYNEGGTFRHQVRVVDNGEGMSKRVLDEVYFTLGKTTKGGDGIGGFGRARILTSFSHPSYTIHTRDNLVLGSYGEYDTKKVAHPIQGCDIRIFIDPDSASFSSIEGNVLTFINQADLPIKFTWNGEEKKSWLPMKRYLQDLEYDEESFAKIYHIPQDELGGRSIGHNWIYRVNGCPMYSEIGESDDIFIVEINPKKSRSVLTASRDSLRSEFRNAIHEYKRLIGSQHKYMTRGQMLHQELKYYEGAGVQSLAFYSENNQDARHEQPKQNKITKFKTINSTEELRLMVDHKEKTDSMMNQVFGELKENEIKHTYKISEFISDIPIQINTSKEPLVKAAERFSPALWEFQIHDNRAKILSGRLEWELYLAWEAAITGCLKTLNNKWLKQDIKYVCGFVFDEDVEGLHKQESRKHSYFFRPTNEEGVIRFDPHYFPDFVYILAIAKHEVVHTTCQYHDESFTNLHMIIDSSVDPFVVFKEFKRIAS